MDGRKQHVHERTAGEEAVDEPQGETEQPARMADRTEDRVVGEREEDPVDEMEEVADHVRAAPVRGEDRAEQKRDVHAREPQLLRQPQAGRQHDRPDDASRDGRPERHSRPAFASSIDTAALTRAR